MAKRIAIVEDDQDQRANYSDAITKKGYDVAAYGSREEALAGIEREMPDLAILDIILGDEVDAGFQLCRDLLVRAPTLPVIFLTERIGEIDKISGLRLGAWDYLPKPISLDYLAERISSLLRINEVRSKFARKHDGTTYRRPDTRPGSVARVVEKSAAQSVRNGIPDARQARPRTGPCRQLRNTDERNDAKPGNEQHDQHAHAQHSQKIREGRWRFRVHQERVWLRLSLDGSVARRIPAYTAHYTKQP